MIVIESNIELPITMLQRSKYPFRDMAVGDSFGISGDAAERERVRAAAYKHSDRNGVRIIVRQQKEGFRVWRVA